MKIIDTFYSVVAVIVAVILFTQSVAGDDSYKSKAGKGGPAGADLAAWLRQAVLVRALVGQVYEMAGVALGSEIEREGFQQILGSDYFAGSAVWDIDIFSAVNVNEDDVADDEELVTHIQKVFPFGNGWLSRGVEGSKAGKGGNADPEVQFWGVVLAQRLAIQVFEDTGLTIDKRIGAENFHATARLRYDQDDFVAGLVYGKVLDLSNDTEYIDYRGLITHAKKHVVGGMLDGMGGPTELERGYWGAVNREISIQQFYLIAEVEVGQSINVEHFVTAVGNLQSRGFDGAATALFAMIDSNRDGSVDIYELKAFFM